MIAMLMLLAACSKAPLTPSEPHVPTTGPRIILPNGTVISVEIAADDQTRAQGLMFRDSLPPNTGMLFFFPQDGHYAFWMKNCRMALDLIWIDSNRTVVHIKERVPPCPSDPCPSYPPNVMARYVLELEGGDAGLLGLKLGDALRFEGMENVVPR